MTQSQRAQISECFDEQRRELADWFYRMECAAILQASKDNLSDAELENILSSCRLAIVTTLQAQVLTVLRQSEALVVAQKLLSK
jgi:hypothetical protein